MSRPNILIVIPHDLGDHLCCYGHTKVRSPNLDRFAGPGVRFANNFAVAPECTPSRSSLFTGLYGHQHGLMGLCHRGWEYDDGAVHLAQRLAESGYATHLFGVQHETGGDGSRLGYQHLHSIDNLGCEPVADAAVRFLQSDDAKAGPWFACVGFQQVHRGSKWPENPSFGVADVQVPPWLPDNETSRREFARFSQCIENMDAAAGRIFDALRHSRAYDNTLAVFTVDHGIGFPRAKSTLYDPGIRTALMMQWPRRIAGNSARDQLISNIDLTPTILDACDIDVPADMPGRSFLPLLERQPYDERDAAYGVLYYDAKYDPMAYVRTKTHKYIRSFAVDPDEASGADQAVLAKHDCGNWVRAGDTDVQRADTWAAIEKPYGTVASRELYDLQADPLEQRNLADDPQHADLAAELDARVMHMLRDTGSPLPDKHVSPALSSTRNEVVKH
jgi:arylsulfatase A-like enzyme